MLPVIGAINRGVGNLEHKKFGGYGCLPPKNWIQTKEEITTPSTSLILLFSLKGKKLGRDAE